MASQKNIKIYSVLFNKSYLISVIKIITFIFYFRNITQMIDRLEKKATSLLPKFQQIHQNRGWTTITQNYAKKIEKTLTTKNPDLRDELINCFWDINNLINYYWEDEFNKKIQEMIDETNRWDFNPKDQVHTHFLNDIEDYIFDKLPIRETIKALWYTEKEITDFFKNIHIYNAYRPYDDWNTKIKNILEILRKSWNKPETLRELANNGLLTNNESFKEIIYCLFHEFFVTKWYCNEKNKNKLINDLRENFYQIKENNELKKHHKIRRWLKILFKIREICNGNPDKIYNNKTYLERKEIIIEEIKEIIKLYKWYIWFRIISQQDEETQNESINYNRTLYEKVSAIINIYAEEMKIKNPYSQEDLWKKISNIIKEMKKEIWILEDIIIYEFETLAGKRDWLIELLIWLFASSYPEMKTEKQYWSSSRWHYIENNQIKPDEKYIYNIIESLWLDTSKISYEYNEKIFKMVIEELTTEYQNLLKIWKLNSEIRKQIIELIENYFSLSILHLKKTNKSYYKYFEVCRDIEMNTD